MDFQQLLNPEQLRPVMDTDGAVLVLAGAGSGKTRVLTYRIAYLIEERGVNPYNILAITFTNKAASEMKERVLKVTGKSGVFISTFHALCARILRAEIEQLGNYTANFTIYDDNDTTRIIKRVITNSGFEVDKNFYKDVKWHISNAKNHFLNPEEYYFRIKDQKYAKLICDVYAEYEHTLVQSNALDFDDLLLYVVRLFTSNKAVLEKYQDKFQYILVDEFQDTNIVQYMIVRLLAQKYGNIFVVGDDDQSIYGWRWAESENIEKFRKLYKDCRLYKLEQNYRSTGNILNLANKIIAYNTERVGKTLWTEGEKGVGVVYRTLYNEKAEADYVMEQITSLIRYNGYKFSDFAILYRANSISRPFEEKLTLYNYPYKVVGGNKFFDRKEIKDFIAYLKLLANNNDNESLLRIINVPKRGIGDGAISKIVDIANQMNASLYWCVKNVHQLGLPAATARNIAKFTDVICLLENIKGLKLGEFIDRANEIINFNSMYDKSVEEDANRLDNIADFVTAVKEFEHDNKEATLVDFLQSVSLLSDNDNNNQDNDDAVTVATIHGVKGLEYRCVFIVGLEQGIFPTSRSEADDESMQEERRIMYVAVTRAKERLYLTNVTERFRYGKLEYCQASRFLDEGGLIIEREDKLPYEKQYTPTPSKIDFTKISKPTPAFATPSKQMESVGKDLSKFQVGMTVKHTKFGEGKIVEITGENAKIQFPELGVKTFNMRLAPIEIVQ